MLILFFIVVIFTFVIAFFCGLLVGKVQRFELDKTQRQKIYCAGWRDSIYTALGESDPKYYFEKKAIDGFKEYESIYNDEDLN